MLWENDNNGRQRWCTRLVLGGGFASPLLDRFDNVYMWQPGAKAAVLTALQYHAGQMPLLTQEWTTDAVTGGVLASPVFSADGSTLYVNSRDGKLWALSGSEGKPKWSVAL